MKYADGQTIEIGDRVGISDGSPGVVVAILEEGLACPEFPLEEWSYLEGGLIVNTKKAGIIHYPTEFLYHISLESRSDKP